MCVEPYFQMVGFRCFRKLELLARTFDTKVVQVSVQYELRLPKKATLQAHRKNRKQKRASREVHLQKVSRLRDHCLRPALERTSLAIAALVISELTAAMRSSRSTHA